MKHNDTSLISGCGFFAGVAIAIFVVLRFMSGNQFQAVFDLVLSLSFLAISYYTYVTGNLVVTRYIGAIIAVAGTMITLIFDSHFGVYWVYATTVVLFYLLPYRRAIAFVVVTVLGASLLLWRDNTYTHLLPFFVTVSLVIVFSSLFALDAKRKNRELEILSIHDELTGAGNRRAFSRKINAAVKLYKRNGLPASLIYLDIDNFKSINDTLGHAAGDQALVAIAGLVKSNLRETDSLFRIGGDEFVVIVEGADQQAARLVAEKLRRSIESKEILSDRILTVSLGLSEIEGDDTSDSWISRADSALYQSKKAGRNRVEIGSSLVMT